MSALDRAAAEDRSTVETSLTGAPPPRTEAELDEYLSRPTKAAVDAMAALSGDLVVLGAGGKMGLGLCTMARRSWDVTGASGRVVAVSHFRDARTTRPFEAAGIETIAADLLEPTALAGLPDAANVLYLAGRKFGSTGDEPTTWAINALLPGLVARRYAAARIVALSTGNVYPFTVPREGGSREDDTLAPVGEYAQSCLARERILEYHSRRDGTAFTLIRLNYANALRYGVLTDIATGIRSGAPIDVTTGFVNIIWQGDASAAILASFGLAATPPALLNVTGPETVSVREVAIQLADLLGAPPPTFSGTEGAAALLNNASRQHALFGAPAVALEQLAGWTAAWLLQGGDLLGKPTHFQARDGRF